MFIGEALAILRQAGGTSSLLFGVLAEADRRLTNGDVLSGLELIGVVQRHPGLASQNASEIGRILGRSDLPADVIEQGLAAGIGQTSIRSSIVSPKSCLGETCVSTQ